MSNGAEVLALSAVHCKGEARTLPTPGPGVWLVTPSVTKETTAICI